MPKVFLPQRNQTLLLSPHETLMEQLQAQEIPVASSCGGDGICGKCKVFVKTEGDPLSTPSELELKTLQKSAGEPGERLSCQLHCQVAMVVTTTYW